MKVSTMNEDVVIRLKPNELNAIIAGMNGSTGHQPSEININRKVLLQLQCVKELL